MRDPFGLGKSTPTLYLTLGFVVEHYWTFVVQRFNIVGGVVRYMRGEKTYKKSPPYTYECSECGHRMKADHQPMECPECEGEMLNISKPQE